MTKRHLLLPIFALAAACSGDAKNDSDADPAAAEDLYSLSMKVSIDANEGEAVFLTPTASAQSFSTQDIIGKPWYVGFFDAGALPGVDPAVIEHWGTMDEDLEISYTTPAQFDTGPHDTIFIIFINAEVTEEDKAGEFPPLAVTGDLSSFTLAERVLEEDDPELSVAYLRINVDDADAEIAIRNKTPSDWSDTTQLVDAFIDTVLVVP